MSRQLELMSLRERRIGELVERISEKSGRFSKPRMIVIGGYALRAYVPFSRYSRDCDFALPKRRGWSIDRIAKWFPDLTVEAKQSVGRHGFLRLVQALAAGKARLKISLDFMEGEVRGRSDEALRIDRRFVAESVQAAIRIGERPLSISVPSYQDYFLLKLFSGRPSDVRDIAALVWKRSTPDHDSFLPGHLRYSHGQRPLRKRSAPSSPTFLIHAFLTPGAALSSRRNSRKPTRSGLQASSGN